MQPELITQEPILKGQKRTNNRYTCLIRSVSILLLTLVAILVGLKLYSDHLVRQAETEYPPAEFVTVERLQLHYVSEGSGRPVVFIPGGYGKIQDFTLSPLFDPVATEFQAIFLDRPGLGYSERPTHEDATPSVQVRLIHGALQQLNVEKPVLVGQSWGGIMALQYALDYPDDLAGIVLLGVAPYPRERASDPISELVRMPILGDLVLHTLYVPIGYHIMGPAFLEESVEYFAPLNAVPASYSATMGLEIRPNHVKAGADEERIIPPCLETLSARFGEVSVPVVIVAGDLDTYAIEQAPRLEEDIPNSRVVVVEGANHLLWFSFPEVVVDAVRETWTWADETGTAGF
jgi:pimeloyl-ACP methyl ester carboxylesterase